MKHNAQEE